MKTGFEIYVNEGHFKELLRTEKRWLCNELVCDVCGAIPALKASDRILLIACNMHTYLAPRYRKKLIYRDAIAFLRAMLDKNRTAEFRIDQMNGSNETEHIVLYQKQHCEENYEKFYGGFLLKTNQLRFQMHFYSGDKKENEFVKFAIRDYHFDCTQMHYFLCLIAPLIRPIMLGLRGYFISNKPIEELIEELVHFLNTRSNSYIDWIKVLSRAFNSSPIFEALIKYDKLQLIKSWGGHIDVPKFIHWLTAEINGDQQRKCSLQLFELDEITKLFDEIKKDFICATRKCRFVVETKVCEPLLGFTLCNERTDEQLVLRCTNSGFSYLCELSRRPIEEKLDNNEYADFESWKMTEMYLGR